MAENFSNRNKSYNNPYLRSSTNSSTGAWSRNNSNSYNNRRDSNANTRQWSQNYNNWNKPDRSSGYRNPDLSTTDDEFNIYAVNLLLKPVEMGIVGRNDGTVQKFEGLGAFNHYFGLLAPAKALGYTLPDVWDGYFHITLAKFSTQLEPNELENAFNKFTPDLRNMPYIPDITFQASRITIITGAARPKKLRGIDFIVLAIDKNKAIETFFNNVQPLLYEIKCKAESNKWDPTLLDELHVTIRKYSNIEFDLRQIKIAQFPLEFQCSHLEIKQTRDRATTRFKQAEPNIYRWWTGITVIRDRCSGCQVPILSNQWEGFCLACGKYESIIPIWLTDGRIIKNYQQIENEENTNNPYNP